MLVSKCIDCSPSFPCFVAWPHICHSFCSISVAARMSRTVANRVFQAALKKKEDAERQRTRQAQSAGIAVAPTTAAAAHGSGPAANQQTRPLQPLTEARHARSTASISHNQSESAPFGRLPSVTTSSASEHKSSDGPIAKRPCPDPHSPALEKLDVEPRHRFDSEHATPVMKRIQQATPSTQTRPYTFQTQRVDAGGSPRTSIASPQTAQPVPRLASFSPIQTRSPPTPQRNVTARAPVSGSLHKMHAPSQQSPANSTQLHHTRLFHVRVPAPSVGVSSSLQNFAGRNSYTSSTPPLNEPTAPCVAPSDQRASPFHVGAGFHNDGNTCYLRSYCNSHRSVMFLVCITRGFSAALVILLSQASFVNEASSPNAPATPCNSHVLPQLLSEYQNFFAQGQSECVHNFPCLAEVPSRLLAPTAEFRCNPDLMFLQLVSLATWKRFNPSRHLKRQTTKTLHCVAITVIYLHTPSQWSYGWHPPHRSHRRF